MKKLKLDAVAVVGLLLVSVSCTATRFGGMTARQAFPEEHLAKLVEAIGQDDYAEADKQLKAGAKVNMVGTDGISALMWVIATRNLKGTEYLLKAGANPNYRDEKRKASAMVLGAGGDSPEVLELLLKYKGDPNLIGPNGDPLLHVAVGQFRQRNLELLLEYGANINVVDATGDTAAQEAAALGRYDLVVYFLEKGLNYNLQGLAKTVDSTVAGPRGRPWKDKVIEMLKERGAKFPAFDPKNPQGR